MRRFYRWMAGLFALCLTFQLCHVTVRAAYTYTVTFYIGSHGGFSGDSSLVNVDNSNSGSAYEVHMSASSVTVSNLQYGDRVNFDAAMAGAVDLGESSKYYVKGIRQSGRDNDTVGLPSFEVKGDQDYVVAYGIRGDQTSYVVNYLDASGNTLAPSRTYYGNVGDRPVIAFLYIEGYEPQAYNLTRTLSGNAAENVFDFTYSRISSGGTAAAGGGGAAAPAVPEGEAAAGTQPAGGAAETGAAGGGAAADAGAAGAGAGAADAGAADAGAGVPVPDEEVPQAEGPEELQELDDEEVPLADGILPEGRQVNMLGAVAVGVTASAALIGLFFFLIRKKQANREEEDNE